MTRHLVKVAAQHILQREVTLRPHNGRCVIFVDELGYPGRTWDDALEFLVNSVDNSVSGHTETDDKAVS